MDDFSDFDGPLPDIYRSREAFFATLPAWRRFLAKLNWHPTIDSMVDSYHHQQAAARRDQALAAPVSSMSSDPLLAELNAELIHRSVHATTSTQAASPKPEIPAPPARRRRSWRNAVKASLLLLLGIGIAILMFSSGVIQLLLLLSIPVFLVVSLLGFLWQAIYETLQEGDQPPPP
jgi:hypothetical protein